MKHIWNQLRTNSYLQGQPTPSPWLGIEPRFPMYLKYGRLPNASQRCPLVVKLALTWINRKKWLTIKCATECYDNPQGVQQYGTTFKGGTTVHHNCNGVRLLK
jgi:hypothetical protein